jgi:hypothetical protein
MSDTQKPHAWAVKACSKMWTGEFAEVDAKAEAARVGCMGHAYPLFTKPTPPEGWDEATETAQYVKDGGVFHHKLHLEMAYAILDMDKLIKEGMK